MSGPLHRLGGLAARRAPWFLVAWVVLTAALAIGANSAGRPTNDDLNLPGTGSTQATDLLEQKLPQAANGSVPIVIHTDKGTLTEGANKQAVQATVESLSKDRYVTSAIDPFSQPGNITDDGKTAIVSVALNVSSGDLDDTEANEVFDAADPAREAGLEVSAGGYLGSQLSSPSTGSSEAVGIAVAIVVLLLAFGAAAAVPLPILTAGFALGSGLALVGFAGHWFDVPTLAPTVGIMLGLGVGIDYSLFIINRHQQLLRDGVPVREAIARSMATSGTAVVFAGSTVVIALLCLYFGGIPLVRNLGYSTAIVVATAIIAAVTLLPGMLGLLGSRIEALRVPFLKGEQQDGGAWARWAARVGRHPARGAIGGTVLLLALAIPTLGISLGAPDDGQLPESTTARVAYDRIDDGFGVGVNGPLLVAVDLEGSPANPGDPSSDPALARLEEEIEKQSDVQSISPAQISQSGDAAAFSVIPKTSPSSEATRNLVNHLRDETIPDALAGTSVTAYIGGQTAAYIDLATKIGDRLPLVIAVVVLLSILLLTLAFRSLTISLISAVTNLIAVGAAYGILTAVFENGRGVELIGLSDTVPVVSFVPLMMFAILFGLSMDYQVFLLSRITEHRSGEDNRRAVVDGLGRAARVVSTAAAIMFAVFLSFVLNGDPTVKQFGVGLAVAVAIDALVVLMIFPALMLLLGDRTWWIPAWLDRALPQVGIEGDEKYR